MPRTCKWCGKTASYGRLCDCVNEQTLPPVTDSHRAALVAECDRLREVWREAQRNRGGVQTLIAYKAYVEACDELQRQFPPPATSEPTDGPR